MAWLAMARQIVTSQGVVIHQEKVPFFFIFLHIVFSFFFWHSSNAKCHSEIWIYSRAPLRLVKTNTFHFSSECSWIVKDTQQAKLLQITTWLTAPDNTSSNPFYSILEQILFLLSVILRKFGVQQCIMYCITVHTWKKHDAHHRCYW